MWLFVVFFLIGPCICIHSVLSAFSATLKKSLFVVFYNDIEKRSRMILKKVYLCYILIHRREKKVIIEESCIVESGGTQQERRCGAVSFNFVASCGYFRISDRKMMQMLKRTSHNRQLVRYK